MTAPRIIVRGATTAITRRTVLRKAFLAPWHPLVDDVILYAMAEAQDATGVAIHSSVRNINHHHTTGTPSSDNLPEFTRRFHRELSCALQELLRREKYDTPGQLFDNRPTHMMRLIDAEAQAGHHLYEVLNPVAAGLVERPGYMPMRRVDYTVWKTGFIEVERPPVYFGPKRPEVRRLFVTPPPLLYEAFGGDLDKLVYHLHKLEEDGVADLRGVIKRPFLGAQAVRRLHPWDEPRSFREGRGQRVSTFKIGACGLVGGHEARSAAAEEVTHFRHEHEAARLRRKDGDFEQLFPYGTYGMRVYRGAPVEEQPFLDALVGAPGPTLEEVKERLATERVDRDEVRARSHAIVDAVRSAVHTEARDIVDEAYYDPAAPPSSTRSARPADPPAAEKSEASSQTDETDEDQRPEPETRTHAQNHPSNARRVINRRDRRRGRPRKGRRGPHGSDPPG